MENEFSDLQKVKVLLVGADLEEEQDFDHSMEELKNLAEAAGKVVVGIITQKLVAVDKAFYIGSGKVREAKEFAIECEAQEVVFDNSLTPSQVRNLGRALELPVYDRTNLILDIFALRAQTREAKLQVETARLQYMLPRLVGMHEALSRQGGASGSMSNKGTGEKKLELDRRKIEHRISELKKELASIAESRSTQRKRRNSSRIPQVALVGYTNAGKSTVLNRMVELCGGTMEKQVFEKDLLFATLETSVRKIDRGDNMPFFLTDTVGFINKLPHGLVQAFRSTLEEVKYADLLVQVVDFSDESHRQQMEVTRETLKELEAAGIPQIVVYNKVDRVNESKEGAGIQLPGVHENQIYMAAAKGLGIQELCSLIQEKVYRDQIETSFLLPYDKGGLVSYFMENANVLEQEYRQNGVFLRVRCHKQDAAKYGMFIISE